MCRLFALHAGPHDVPAEFWLLHAPDSFAAQSEHNADGFGIATLSTRDGQLLVRNPIKAANDQTYWQVSQRARASQFLAHLRYASTGEVSLANTHPFLMDNRAFAHNGVVGDLPEVERRLGTSLAMVGGTTDTERFFALLTIRIREADHDVRAGIIAAVHEARPRHRALQPQLRALRTRTSRGHVGPRVDRPVHRRRHRADRRSPAGAARRASPGPARPGMTTITTVRNGPQARSALTALWRRRWAAIGLVVAVGMVTGTASALLMPRGPASAGPGVAVMVTGLLLGAVPSSS